MESVLQDRMLQVGLVLVCKKGKVQRHKGEKGRIDESLCYMKLEEGEIIQSRYRLVSLKGRGSFGEVWLAKDEQTDLEVAVKVYIALDDKGLEEFKAEYKNSYSLNHPNLLHAYYFDVVDRQPFLVMPYCPDSAESLVGNADEKTLLRFIRDVSSGLEYLHARDIIHRDIKPDNILVSQEGMVTVWNCEPVNTPSAITSRFSGKLMLLIPL